MALLIMVVMAQVGMYGLVCWLFKDELRDQCKAVLARHKRSCRPLHHLPIQ